MIRPDRILTTWWICIVMALSGLLVNAAQGVITLLAAIHLIQPQTSLALCQILSNTWWPLWCFLCEAWCGVTMYITADKEAQRAMVQRKNNDATTDTAAAAAAAATTTADNNQLTDTAMVTTARPNSIFMSNHLAGLDFIVALSLLTRVRDIGSGRAIGFMKRVLLWAPFLGWTHYFQGALFLHRSFDADRPLLNAAFADMAVQPRTNSRWPFPFWLSFYPEGTRFSLKKRAAAHAFAETRGLPKFKHLLLPRVKGWQLIMASKVRDVVSGIVDMTIAVDTTLSPKHLLLHGRFKTKSIHIHLDHTPIGRVPRHDKDGAQSKWLMDKWAKKEAMLEELHQHGRFQFQALPSSITRIPTVALRLFWFWAAICIVLVSRIWAYATSAPDSAVGLLCALTMMTLYAGTVGFVNGMREAVSSPAAPLGNNSSSSYDRSAKRVVGQDAAAVKLPAAGNTAVPRVLPNQSQRRRRKAD